MTEAGDTSVLRTGRFFYFTTKNQIVKISNAFTLLARMGYEYVLMKNLGILEYSVSRSINW